MVEIEVGNNFVSWLGIVVECLLYVYLINYIIDGRIELG